MIDMSVDLSKFYSQQDSIQIMELMLEPLIEDEVSYLTQDAVAFAYVTDKLVDDPSWPIETFLLALRTNKDNRIGQLELVDQMLSRLEVHLNTVATQRATEKYLESHI